ncbi:MAG: porin, partial [Bacteroidota bacterium]|nr:porin [Bacteroidota bacterium]
MKRTLLLLACLISFGIIQAQDTIPEPPPGTISAKIYSHFNYSLDPDNPSTAFEVKRAYFGY